MTVLAVGAALAGFFGSPVLRGRFFSLLGDTHVHEGIDLPILALSTLVVVVGTWLGWTVGFLRRNLLPATLRPLGTRLYTWAFNKYYVDEFYSRVIIQPILRLSGRLSRFDQQVVDGAVNGVGRAGWTLGQWKERFDRQVIDRLVNGVAHTMRGLGGGLRLIQTGLVQQYLLVVVASVVLLAIALRH